MKPRKQEVFLENSQLTGHEQQGTSAACIAQTTAVALSMQQYFIMGTAVESNLCFAKENVCITLSTSSMTEASEHAGAAGTAWTAWTA
jgi:hypothetical protein